MRELTHKALVRRAGLWLRNTARCSVVMEEFTAFTKSNEIPDAIGWVGGRCILVECKRARSDFLSDKNKNARKPGFPALGAFRFYFAPPGIIATDDLPEGWGLYEVHDRRVVHAGGVKWGNAAMIPFKSCKDSEVALLLSAIRRLEISTAVFIREESP